MVTCLGCGREAEWDSEPEPNAERDVPILPTGWEAEDDDEYYCPDCVVSRLRFRVEQITDKFEETAKISHEMRNERDRLKHALVECTAEVGCLEGDRDRYKSKLATAEFDLEAANDAFETASRRLTACRQEAEKLTEMRRVGHQRLEALVRRAYVEHVDQDWLEEAESVLGLSKTMTRARPIRDPKEVRSVPGEVLTIDLKGGQVQAWVTTTGVMCMRLAEPPQSEVIICPECGPVDNTDEEACCLSCGADCTIEPAFEYWRQLSEKFGRRGDILHDHLQQVMAPIEDLRKKVEDARHDQEKEWAWEIDDLDEFLCDVFGCCVDCSHYAGGDGDGECHNEESEHHGEHRTDLPMCKDAS
jgi:hypothetical protein